MSSKDDIDSALKEILPTDRESSQGAAEAQVDGKFQTLSSLAAHLGLYADLKNPSKTELVQALSERNVQNAAEEAVYDFLLINNKQSKGFIRSKDGSWIEQDIDEHPDTDLKGGYATFSRLASFFNLYERYGLTQPSENALKQALINYGVENHPQNKDSYLAQLETPEGTVREIGVIPGEVTTAHPLDEERNRIGDVEYTRELLPRLAERLDNEEVASDDLNGQFIPPLPEEIHNLLADEHVAKNYQLIIHRIAEQAAGDGVSTATRKKKLAEARFVTEVLTGERTWQDQDE